MPQLPRVGLKFWVAAVAIGPVNPPVPLRVSTIRQGVTGTKRSPEAADTVMLGLVPAIEDANRSLAPMVCVPTVTSVAVKVPTPLVRDMSAGTTPRLSLLWKCTGSAYAATGLFPASRAVTVNWIGTPFVFKDAATTEK